MSLGTYASARTVTVAPTAPTMPAAPTFADITNSQLRINWAAPANNGSALTELTLQRTLFSNGTNLTGVLTQTATPPTTVTYVDQSLSPNTTYYYRVRYTNGIGSTNGVLAGETTAGTSASLTAPTIESYSSFNGLGTVRLTAGVGMVTDYVFETKLETNGTWVATDNSTSLVSRINTQQVAFSPINAVPMLMRCRSTDGTLFSPWSSEFAWTASED